MPTNDAVALSLAGLSKEFGGLRALDGVSLDVGPGERRAIIGPNGAGKTTLFSLISGETRPTGGRISLFGRDVTRLAPHRRAALGLARTYQITNLFPRLTALENCLLAVQALTSAKFHLHRSLSRYPAFHDRARAVLEAVGLGDKAEEAVRNLSHGEQRQLEIVLGLASDPKILLLDEPAAGLSSGESHEMAKFLMRLDPDLAILLIEHDMDVVFGVTDHISVLHFGKILETGSAEAIRKSSKVQEIYLGTG